MNDSGIDVSYQVNRQKIIFIGDISVGKTSIINVLTGYKFNDEYEASIGVDFFSKTIKYKGKTIKLQIWDSAGQEKFRSLIPNYIRGSSLVFIVYDITNKKSFANIASWLNECREMCYKDILICLVGNKTDLESSRVVTKEQGQKFADDNGLLFFETSAQDGTNIEALFTKATAEIVTKVESGKIQLDTHNTGIKIGKYPNKEIEQALEKKKKGCC